MAVSCVLCILIFFPSGKLSCINWKICYPIAKAFSIEFSTEIIALGKMSIFFFLFLKPTQCSPFLLYISYFSLVRTINCGDRIIAEYWELYFVFMLVIFSVVFPNYWIVQCYSNRTTIWQKTLRENTKSTWMKII